VVLKTPSANAAATATFRHSNSCGSGSARHQRHHRSLQTYFPTQLRRRPPSAPPPPVTLSFYEGGGDGTGHQRRRRCHL